MFTKEMQEALIADGEKLRQMTGHDHSPHFGILGCRRCGGWGHVRMGGGERDTCTLCHGTGNEPTAPNAEER